MASRRLVLLILASGLAVMPSPTPAQGQGPDDPAPDMDRARRSLAAGDYQEAVALLQPACPPDIATVECASLLVAAWMRTGQYDQARDFLAAVVRTRRSGPFLKLLAEVEQADGRDQEAARALHEAAKLDPSEKNVFDLGGFLLQFEPHEPALEIFDFGAKKYPDSARMKVGLGIALYSVARYEEAVETLCAAADLDPSDPRPLEFLGKMHDVSPAMADEVARRLEQFVERHPDNAKANFYYALSLSRSAPEPADKAHGDRVESFLRKALELDPGLFEAHYQLGQLYERLDRTEEAITAYEHAVEGDPELAQAYYRLGRLLIAEGNREAGGEALRKHRALRSRARREDAKSMASP